MVGSPGEVARLPAARRTVTAAVSMQSRAARCAMLISRGASGKKRTTRRGQRVAKGGSLDRGQGGKPGGAGGLGETDLPFRLGRLTSSHAACQKEARTRSAAVSDEPSEPSVFGRLLHGCGLRHADL